MRVLEEAENPAHTVLKRLNFLSISDKVRIPMKAATDSNPKRPPVPIQNGHFGRGSNWAS